MISLIVVVSLVMVEVEGVDVHIYGFRVRVEHYGSLFGFKVNVEVQNVVTPACTWIRMG